MLFYINNLGLYRFGLLRGPWNQFSRHQGQQYHLLLCFFSLPRGSQFVSLPVPDSFVISLCYFCLPESSKRPDLAQNQGPSKPVSCMWQPAGLNPGDLPNCLFFEEFSGSCLLQEGFLDCRETSKSLDLNNHAVREALWPFYR